MEARFGILVLALAGLAATACSTPLAPAPASTHGATTTARSAPSSSPSTVASTTAPAEEDHADLVVEGPTLEGPSIDRAEWSPSGRSLALGSTRAEGDRSGSASAMELFVLDLDKGTLFPPLSIAGKEAGPSYAISLSPDGAYAATSLVGQGIARLFRLADGKILRELTMVGGYTIQWSPDSSRVLFATAFGLNTLVALPRGNVVRAHVPSNRNGASVSTFVVWSPKSDLFVYRGLEIELREAKTGQKRATLPYDLDSEDAALRFSDDGKELFGALPNGLVMRIPTAPPAKPETLRPAGAADSTIRLTIQGSIVYRALDTGIDLFDLQSRTSRLVASTGRPFGELRISPKADFAADEALGGNPTPAIRLVPLAGQASPRSFPGQLLGFTSAGELVHSTGDLLIEPATGSAPPYRVRLKDGFESFSMSPDGKHGVFRDGQLLFLRFQNRSALRVSLTRDKGGLHLAPAPEAIAAFFR